jgi:hypothetical protein
MGKIVVPKEGEEQEQWIEGIHQGIISEKIFYQVQEKLSERQRKEIDLFIIHFAKSFH